MWMIMTLHSILLSFDAMSLQGIDEHHCSQQAVFFNNTSLQRIKDHDFPKQSVDLNLMWLH